jgi:hypothetical protein
MFAPSPLRRLIAASLARQFLGRRTPPAESRRRARLALAAFPVGFALLLAAGWAAAESAAPEITDTDYHRRLAMARARAAEHPDNPLGVVIGSSRLVWGFRPEGLPQPEPGGVYWVNVAHVGGGPVLNRLTLHRLLRDGARPAVAAVEVMPLFFVRENTRFVVGHLSAAELPLARRYGKNALHYDYYFLRHRVWRVADLGRVLDPFAGHPAPLPRGGHPGGEESVTPAERARRTALARQEYRDDLARMAVRPQADQALRDTLAEAAEHGVRVVLLRTPEGPVFRGWYDPAGAARFDAYVAAVAREFGVPVVDAREWLGEDDFYDSHHPLRPGAEKFTARFAREVPAALGR